MRKLFGESSLEPRCCSSDSCTYNGVYSSEKGKHISVKELKKVDYASLTSDQKAEIRILQTDLNIQLWSKALLAFGGLALIASIICLGTHSYMYRHIEAFTTFEIGPTPSLFINQGTDVTTLVRVDSAVAASLLLRSLLIDLSVATEAILVWVTLYPMLNTQKSLDHGSKANIAKNHQATKTLTKRMWVFAAVNILAFLTLVYSFYCEADRLIEVWINDSIAAEGSISQNLADNQRASATLKLNIGLITVIFFCVNIFVVLNLLMVYIAHQLSRDHKRTEED